MGKDETVSVLIQTKYLITCVLSISVFKRRAFTVDPSKRTGRSRREKWGRIDPTDRVNGPYLPKGSHIL